MFSSGVLWVVEQNNMIIAEDGHIQLLDMGGVADMNAHMGNFRLSQKTLVTEDILSARVPAIAAETSSELSEDSEGTHHDRKRMMFEVVGTLG